MIIRKTVILLLIISLGQCASLFADKISNIPVTTTPKGTQLAVKSRFGTDIFKCETPCQIILPKKELTNATIEFSKEGFETRRIFLGEEIEGIYLLNILVWPGLIIDFATGAWKKPGLAIVHVEMEPVGRPTVKATKPDIHMTARVQGEMAHISAMPVR